MKNLFYFFSVSFLKNRLANKIFAFLLFLFLLLPQYACNTTEPPNNQTLLLKLEEISCTEAWVQLTTNNIQLPATINLLKNNTIAQVINLSYKDTLLYIDSLLPNQTYKIRAAMQPYNNASNELSVTTMDTTSHNFTWQTWTFGGQAGSCALYDVAIIDENNIWAVGEIYMNDSLGQPDPNAYNAIHWDGQSWELKRIYTYSSCSAVDFAPLKAIWAFSDTNFVVTNGAGLWWFDGKTYKSDCRIKPLLTGAINKLWGSSSNDLYAVGSNGSIAHWDGRKWTKIESGTDLEFLDIYGAKDPKTGDQQILAVCTRNLPLNKAIYKIDGNTATQISSTPIQWELFSCWFVPNRHYYVVGSGIYEKKFLNDSLWKNEPLDITHYGTSGIRGNGINDVFVAGAFGEFLHFNGVSWKSFINETGWFSGSYGGIAVKNNLVVTVGYEGAQAKILIGYRK